MRRSIALAPVLLLSLAACSGQDADQYAGKKPEITVRQFYRAPIAGYGFFQDGSGQVTGRYYATLVPHWHGNEGTITEKQWSDTGQLFLQQTWHVTADANSNRFTATADKIIGVAKGETEGYAMHMTYTMSVPRENDSDISLSGDDWTYLQPDGSAINRVALSKYGFHVGDITYDLHPLAKGETLREGYFTR